MEHTNLEDYEIRPIIYENKIPYEPIVSTYWQCHLLAIRHFNSITYVNIFDQFHLRRTKLSKFIIDVIAKQALKSGQVTYILLVQLYHMSTRLPITSKVFKSDPTLK